MQSADPPGRVYAKWIWATIAIAIHCWVLTAAITTGSRGTTSFPNKILLSSPVFQNPAINRNPALADSYVLLWGAERFKADQNPLDPSLVGHSNVYYNYPSGWKFLSYLGLSTSDLGMLGWFFGLIFSAALFWALPPFRGRNVLIHILILTSPTTINALGEGNGELLIVALVISSALWASNRRQWGELLSLFCLSIASVLKLYPLAGFGALALCRGRVRWIAVAMGVMITAWLASDLDQIRVVIERTPRPFSNAFGCEMIPTRAQTLLSLKLPWIEESPITRMTVEFLAQTGLTFRFLFFAVVTAGLLRGQRHRLPPPAEDELRSHLLSSMGSILFVGAFGIGHSWNHRLLVPLTCLIAAAAEKRQTGLVIALIAFLWSAVLPSEISFLLEQTMFWTLLFIVSVKLGRRVRMTDRPEISAERPTVVASSSAQNPAS